MIKNHDLIDRFFRYVKIDTQSAEDTGTQPSTAKQHDLAKLLYKELHEMGVEAHYDRKNCYVYAKLPGEEPAIGFIAHMDTSPAASGANVHPRIEENYQGHSIVLFKGHAGSESIVMRHEAFPELQNHIGEDLIIDMLEHIVRFALLQRVDTISVINESCSERDNISRRSCQGKLTHNVFELSCIHS